MSWESKPNLVTAIIPAYNEEGRVGKVVSTACQVNYLRDIIVVDDGSSDASAQEAVRAARGDPRLRVIRHPKNMGKGRALFTGWREARTPYLIMLDADLLNLKPEHIEALIEPVLCGEADMTVGLFVHGQYFSDAAHWFTPWLSGQRCLHTDMLQHISPDAAEGYGFETSLTLAARRCHWRTRHVPLPGVSHPLGHVPRGGWHGPRQKLQMFAHIVRAWYHMEGGKDLVQRSARRVRTAFLVVLAFTFSLVSNCSLATVFERYSFLTKWMNDEAVLQFWGKLKDTLQLLQ